MEKINITEIQITPIPANEGHVGFASFLYNGNLKISGVGIHTSLSAPCGLRLVFPRFEYSGSTINLIFPVNKHTYNAMVDAVACAYEELVAKLRKGDKKNEQSSINR